MREEANLPPKGFRKLRLKHSGNSRSQLSQDHIRQGVPCKPQSMGQRCWPRAFLLVHRNESQGCALESGWVPHLQESRTHMPGSHLQPLLVFAVSRWLYYSAGTSLVTGQAVACRHWHSRSACLCLLQPKAAKAESAR